MKGLNDSNSHGVSIHEELLGACAIAVYALDLEGNFVCASPQLAEISGYSNEDVMGQSFAMLTGPGMLSTLNDAFRRVIEEGEQVNGRLLQVICKNGVTKVNVLIHWRLARFSNDETLIAGSMIQSDYLPMEAESLRLANFPRDNPYPVVQVASDGVVAYANQAGTSFLDACGGRVGAMVHEDIRKLITDVTVSGNNRQVDMECGRRMYTLTLVPSLEAGLVNVYGIDITERMQAEEELRLAYEGLEKRIAERTVELRKSNAQLMEQVAERKRAEDELREINRKLNDAQNQLLQSEKLASVGQLAAGVAHEINNPVGYIKSNLGTLRHYVDDLLKVLDAYQAFDHLLEADPAAAQRIAALKDKVDMGYLREDLLQLIGESDEGVQRVKQIVQDLKDFSHVDEAEWQWADIHKCLESTLNIVHNEVKYKAEVVKEYGDLPNVECIPSQLNQVFTNLLVNASQAIEKSGVISVRTGREDGQVWIQVADTGKGIAQEHMQKLFDPFFTTKPVGKGTGLGLSLSYGIVTKHGGRIDVASEPGKGTTFTVWLPIAQSEPREDREAFNSGVYSAAFTEN